MFFLSLTVVIFPSTQHFTAPTVVYQHPDEVPETPTSPSAYYCSKILWKKGGGGNPNKPSENQATELRNKTATRQTPPPPERGMKPGSPPRLPGALRRRGRPRAAGGARGRPGVCHQPRPPAPALRPGGLPPHHRPGERGPPPGCSPASCHRGRDRGRGPVGGGGSGAGQGRSRRARRGRRRRRSTGGAGAAGLPLPESPHKARPGGGRRSGGAAAAVGGPAAGSREGARAVGRQRGRGAPAG